MDLIGKVRPLRHVFCRWMAWPCVLISGTPCQDAEFQQMTTEVKSGFKVLTGNGCPDHPMFLRLNQVWQVWWKNCFACFVYSFDSFFVSFLWQRQNKIYHNCECWKYVIADQCRPHFWKPPGGREDEHWQFLCDIYLVVLTPVFGMVWDSDCLFVLKSSTTNYCLITINSKLCRSPFV